MKYCFLVSLFFVNLVVKANLFVSNPGFESGQLDWNLQKTSPASGTVVYNSSPAHSGSSCCAVNVTAVDGQNWHIQLQLPSNWVATSGKTYNLTFYCKVNSDATIHVAQHNGAPSYGYITGSDVSVKKTDLWKKVEFNFVASASGSGAQRINIYLGNTATVYSFDDFTLDEVIITPPTPLSPPAIGAYYSGVYRNLFKEAGKTDAEITAKVEATFQQLFYGDNTNERVYFPVGTDMGYIMDINNKDARTEGMSYGMMVCVQLDKKDEFDRLWKFSKTYMQNQTGNRKGYFAWSVNPTTHAILDPNSAPDGEEYYAMALFFAAHRWGNGTGIFNYNAEANQILHDMIHLEERNGGINNGLTNMFNLTEKKVVFVPQQPNDSYSDPSYHLPAFYKLWAEWANEDKAFWKAAADTSRNYLIKAMHPKTGLVTDYMTFDAKPKPTTFNTNSNLFCADSWRVAMNIGVDCHWWGNATWQPTQMDKYISFFDGNGAGYRSIYNQDGTFSTVNWGHSVGCVSMNAAGVLATTTSKSWSFLNEFWITPLPTGTYRYYDGMLYLLGFLNCSGMYKIWMPSLQNQQTIALNKGWNIISFNVSPTNKTIDSVFKNVLTNVQEIKTADSFWKNGQNTLFQSLKSIEDGKGYLVKMNASVSLIIPGTPLTISNPPFTIKPGWQLVGCPYTTTSPISKDFNTNNCSSVKNFDGFWIPNGTVNSIQNLEPGKGYFIKIK